MAFYRQKYSYGMDMFENAAWISDNSIALPVGPHLDEADMVYIAETLIETAEDVAR